MSQAKAVFTLSKYSLLATLRSPTSIVFSLLFPIIFITVFGSIIGDKNFSMKVALAPDCDTSGFVYKAITKIPAITIQKNLSDKEQLEWLKKGRITAILNITPDGEPFAIPHYAVHLQTSNSAGNSPLLKMMIEDAVHTIDDKIHPHNLSVAKVTMDKIPGRRYKSIDFILPGQLGFSLLMAGVFGSSFLLFSMRQGLVLKRMRVTPVKRSSIIAGEMLSRLFFHIISFAIMVGLGYYAFGFTLVNGMVTFFEMLCFSLLGLLIFMSIGFIISGLVNNESAIAPISNTLVLPQILLCGLFFPVDSYPHWLQGLCNALPLTLFVDGLRRIAFENVHIWQMPDKVTGLLIWSVIMGTLSVFTFKWE